MKMSNTPVSQSAACRARHLTKPKYAPSRTQHPMTTDGLKSQVIWNSEIFQDTAAVGGAGLQSCGGRPRPPGRSLSVPGLGPCTAKVSYPHRQVHDAEDHDPHQIH